MIEFSILKERNIFAAENFIHSLIDRYEKHTIHSQMVVQEILKHSTFISKTHFIFFRKNIKAPKPIHVNLEK